MKQIRTGWSVLRSLSVNQDRYRMSIMADNTNDVDDELLYDATMAAQLLSLLLQLASRQKSVRNE